MRYNVVQHDTIWYDTYCYMLWFDLLRFCGHVFRWSSVASVLTFSQLMSPSGDLHVKSGFFSFRMIQCSTDLVVKSVFAECRHAWHDFQMIKCSICSCHRLRHWSASNRKLTCQINFRSVWACMAHVLGWSTVVSVLTTVWAPDMFPTGSLLVKSFFALAWLAQVEKRFSHCEQQLGSMQLFAWARLESPNEACGALAREQSKMRDVTG